MKQIKLTPSFFSAHDISRGLIFSSLLFLFSCGGSLSSIYDSSSPLSHETAKSKSSQLSVKIPQGWFTAEDNETKLIDLWLVKDDYSATLNFIALNLDSLTRKEIRNDELKGAAELSKTFRKAKYGKSFKGFLNEELFEINKKLFSAYEYVDDSKRTIRVVVFKYSSKFFELTAVPVKPQDLQELFKIQNSVLTSVTDY